MHIRYLKNTDEIIAGSPLMVQNPAELKGRWRSLTGAGTKELYLEIGCGKGGFARQKSAQKADALFVGVEKLSTVLARALLTSDIQDYPNLRFIREDALHLTDFFDEGEVDGLYLNFSDPWPKKRHEMRRLTSPVFLPLYEKILKKEGLLRFKTDQKPLYDFSLEALEACGWTVLRTTEDLHQNGNPLSEGDCMTEYEENFVSEGKPIYCIEAKKLK